MKSCSSCPKKTNFFLATSMISACLGTTTAAGAQQSMADDIVVTAQRREQNLQDVGVSVTAISGQQIKSLGLTDAKDIGKIAAGVVFDSAAGGSINNTLTIRGVSQSDFSPNQEAPNSVYLDDVYISSPSAAGFTFFDLERIEVLRGPQGTLFGRASSGGLVNYISRRPTEEFDGYFELGYGSFHQHYTEAAIGGALAQGVRARVSGRWERADGYLRNLAPGGEDTFERHSWGLRGQIEFDLSASVTARMVMSYDRSPRHREGMYKTLNAYIDDNGNPAPLPIDLDAFGTGPGNDFAGYRDPNSDAHRAAFNNVGFFESRRFSPTLYLEWDLGQATISSITNYMNFRANYDEDCDGGPIDFCNIPILQSLKQFSQEVRVNGSSGPMNWTAGIYYLDVNQHVTNSFLFPELSGTDFAFDDSNPVHQKLKSVGFFGQMEYRFSDRIRGILGARYTHDDKSFDSKVFFHELGNGYDGGVGSVIYDPPLVAYDFSEETVGSLARAKKNMWSGKVQLDYTPNDNTLLYAGVSRGVKGPGFNINLGATLTNEETPFKAEHLYAYEIGAKLELLDRKLRANGALFLYDYSDFQGYAFNGLTGRVGNYDGSFKGGEIELTAMPGPLTTFRIGVSYLESKVKNVIGAYTGLRNMQSIQSPKWTVNGLASQGFDIGSGRLTAQWSFDYLSKRYSSIDNNFATTVPGSFVHNARISYLLETSNVEFSAFVNNISDVDRMNYSFDLVASTGSLLRTYAKPRWWGISVRKSW